jgi:hypothetical protein
MLRAVVIWPQERHKESGMRRLARAGGIAGVLLTMTATRSSGTCGAAVEATPSSADSVAVHVCFIATGCLPHNPRVAIAVDTIRITYIQAELPDCVCVTPVFEFTDTIVVHPIQPGRYTVSVVVVNCAEERTIGAAEVTLDGIPNIPMLGGNALLILGLLIAAAALWRLRA